MHTPPAFTSPQVQQSAWHSFNQVPDPNLTAIDDIIDSYIDMAPSTGPHSPMPLFTTEPQPMAWIRDARAIERTPSPLPHINLPKKRKRKASSQQAEPPRAPTPGPVPLPQQLVPPYAVQPNGPQPSYYLQAAPFVAVPPPAVPTTPTLVPLPRYGFIQELPQHIMPHSFTPMYMAPNGRFSYYLFADGDGVAKVALIGRVDQMQELYRGLASEHAPPPAQPYAPAPGPAHGAGW